MIHAWFLIAFGVLPSVDPAAGGSASDEFARHVLVLADGSVRRGPARATAAGFEVREGRGRREIAREQVRDARLERALVDELAGRRRALDPRDLGARAELGAWMFEVGLDAEALDELDYVLWKRPNDARALALLRAAPTRVSTDLAPAGASRAEILRAGARERGARREVIAARLVFDPARETLPDALVEELGSSVNTRRAFACLALRRVLRGAKLGPLAVHAVLDPTLDVRDEAIAALRDARDPRACAAVVQALANPSSRVRVGAIEALGRMGYAQSIEPLVRLMAAAAAKPAGGGGVTPVRANLFVGLETAYVRDFDVEIAQGASIADPIVGQLTSGVVFDVGVGGVSTVSASARDEIWAASVALTRLTGRRLGTDVAGWKAWWDSNRQRFTSGSEPTTAR